jgi:hypothetical protein
MKILDSGVRMLHLMQGSGRKRLREQLEGLQVRIPLTDSCLAELVSDADKAVLRTSSKTGQSYVEQFRTELALRARFIQQWTGSDEDLSLADGETLQDLVRIARKYALPRPWKLSEPVVVEYRRLRPSYQQWTDDIDPGVAA